MAHTTLDASYGPFFVVAAHWHLTIVVGTGGGRRRDGRGGNCGSRR
jgi:hypothetical protein